MKKPKKIFIVKDGKGSVYLQKKLDIRNIEDVRRITITYVYPTPPVSLDKRG